MRYGYGYGSGNGKSGKSISEVVMSPKEYGWNLTGTMRWSSFSRRVVVVVEYL